MFIEILLLILANNCVCIDGSLWPRLFIAQIKILVFALMVLVHLLEPYMYHCMFVATGRYSCDHGICNW